MTLLPSTPDTAKPTAWNPRYLAYCRAQGTPDPDRMLERDRERWPGGVMCGFTLWLSDRWQAWFRAIGGEPRIVFEEHHRAFDRWLFAQVGLDTAATA